MLLQYLPVPKALLPMLAEAFPCILEERELGMELAFDEYSLAPADLDSGQKLPTGVGVNAQEVSYLVRSSKRRNDNTDCRSKCNRE